MVHQENRTALHQEKIMSRKRKNPEATVHLAPLSLSTQELVQCKMVDTEVIEGVAYSPRYRKWRAYLHVGRKQVYHRLCETKEAAIEARREALMAYHRISSAHTKGDGAASRINRAPKLINKGRAVTRLSVSAQNLLRSSELMTISKTADRVDLSRKIGSLIVFVDLLVLQGVVSTKEIEEGMKVQVATLE